MCLEAIDPLYYNGQSQIPGTVGTSDRRKSLLGEGYRPRNEHEVSTDGLGAGQRGELLVGGCGGWDEPKGGNVVIDRFLVKTNEIINCEEFQLGEGRLSAVEDSWEENELGCLIKQIGRLSALLSRS